MSTTTLNAVETPIPQRQVEVPATLPLPEIAPLDRALEMIRADSRRRPEAYLEETEVPDGGE
jgi:hypothetical protein